MVRTWPDPAQVGSGHARPGPSHKTVTARQGCFLFYVPVLDSSYFPYRNYELEPPRRPVPSPLLAKRFSFFFFF